MVKSIDVLNMYLTALCIVFALTLSLPRTCLKIASYSFFLQLPIRYCWRIILHLIIMLRNPIIMSITGVFIHITMMKKRMLKIIQMLSSILIILELQRFSTSRFILKILSQSGKLIQQCFGQRLSLYYHIQKNRVSTSRIDRGKKA